MKRNNARGFTLIELLVVMSLLAVATGIGTTVLIKSWDLWGSIRDGAELDSTSQDVFAAMEKDLGSILNSQIAGVALAGTSDTRRDRQFFAMALANDRMTIPVEIPLAAGGSTSALVAYQIERQPDDSWALVRSVQPLVGGGEPNKQAIAKGAFQLRIEYAAAVGAWQPVWDQTINPTSVRVSLVLGYPADTPQIQTARKATFSVRVP